MYLDRVAWAIVNEKELPVCGTSPDTMVSSRHKPRDAASTNLNFRNYTRYRGLLTKWQDSRKQLFGKIGTTESKFFNNTFCGGRLLKRQQTLQLKNRWQKVG